MAEIQQNNSANNKKANKRKNLSTRVDLTPMVDLGFLLITFFIFTTSMSKPVAMKLNMPKTDGLINTTLIPQSKVLTLLPAANNIVYYYYGNDKTNIQPTSLSNTGLRTVILNKRKQVALKYGDAKEMIVLIKPADNSTYQNLVDVLDEMQINSITRYMLLDIDKDETQLVKN